MSTYRIAVVVGSLRKDSFNRKLALAIANSPRRNSPSSICESTTSRSTTRTGRQPAGRSEAAQVGDRCGAGLLFVTPEYNRSMPGVLKNAIDQASRPYGQSAWAGKPAGVIGVSVGAIGTAMAQQHLRNVLAYLDVPTLGQPEAFVQNKEGLFTESGDIGIESTRKFLQGWVDKYVRWVKTTDAQARVPGAKCWRCSRRPAR